MARFGHTIRTCQKCFRLLNATTFRQTLPTTDLKIERNSSNLAYHRFSSQRANYLSYSTSTESKEHKTSQHTTVDDDELQKFTRLAARWWDEKGEFYALHSMNTLRIPLIRDALVTNFDLLPSTLPLNDKTILDVGSGGGIVAEPLARLGATVTGIDMVEENIKIAQTHLMEDPSIAERVKYIHCAVEDLVLTHEGKFDAIVSSEVVEHVSDVDMFISACCKLLKPGGSLFITTLNKTYVSYGLAVFAAEQLLRVVPPGTHDWNKFVPPEDLQLYLEQNGMTVKLLHGMCYNPIINKWSWISNTDINYAIHAVKTIHHTQTIEQTEY